MPRARLCEHLYPTAPAMSASPDPGPHIRTAMHYPDHVCEGRRYHDTHAGGPIHWPIAIGHAKRARCCTALEAIKQDHATRYIISPVLTVS